ncbi:MAG: carboxylating nicotinate-nucleotide diphosphorylase [Candidatus Marinimicrobia bacterium]|nr:carboxylating nicotinate-nucleotide diphosphorylase [Candidatus Neomarinimicrobiota bacterium]
MTNWLEKIPCVYQKSILGTIQQALTEDIGTGDLTTLATIPTEAVGTGTFTVKSDGIIAGLAVVGLVFQELDRSLHFFPRVTDGKQVTTGTIIATIKGPVCNILSGERTALNFLQRMSGIATYTYYLTRKVAHTRCKLLDTRKTAPGLRMTDKWAVMLGGGSNHRIGLFDMVLIKDNHIKMAGSITAAVNQARRFLSTNHLDEKITIEVEVKSIEELKEALELNVDRIMLDNMDLDALYQAVELVGGTIPLEASGNIKGDTIRQVAETGVDYISSGALTHSVTALDISLMLELKKYQ